MDFLSQCLPEAAWKTLLIPPMWLFNMRPGEGIDLRLSAKNNINKKYSRIFIKERGIKK
jgi:hypothetical protein